MEPSDISKKIEALLFALGRPLPHKELGSMLGVGAGEVAKSLAELQARMGGGVALVDDGTEAELRVAPDASALIEKIRKEEYSREIGKAGMEALAAVLYRGALTRSEIDFIRGVNSSQTIRTLTMRGLLRKVETKGRRGSYLYEPTTELLSQLGVSRPQDLPEYAVVKTKLQALEDAYRQKQSDS